MKHGNLCEYLDIIRSKHGLCTLPSPSLALESNPSQLSLDSSLPERIIVVSEYIGRPLTEAKPNDLATIQRIFHQIAAGLEHIHAHHFSMQNLEPQNVLVDEGNANVKLFNYGMFHQTNGGEFVEFPIG